MQDNLQISAVSETLFMPLYALALESQSRHPIMVDEGAVELTQRLNEAFAASDKGVYKRLVRGNLPKMLVSSLTLRIRHYDRCVRDFLDRQPEGIVVNLGCGLNERCRRVDNGRVRCYDLDLPEVIALRRQLLPETDRWHFIATSVLDMAWFDALPDEPGQRFLFVAEGLFMYLPADDVRTLVTTLHERYPGAELIAEIAHQKIVRMMQGRLGRGKFRRQFGMSQNVVYHFGLEDSRQMEAWALGIKFLDDWTYFDEDEPKLGWIRLFAWLALVRRAQWTARYRLGSS